MKRIFLALALFLSFARAADAETKLQVVTTLATFADLVQVIGGDLVEVKYLAPAQFNPHFFEPRPSDVLRLKRAELFVHAGLDLEAWRASLLEAAGRPEFRAGGERALDLSQGIKLLNVPGPEITRAQGDIHAFGNPHYWVSPVNVKIMSQTIAQKLIELSPENSTAIQANAAKFSMNLDAKIAAWQAQFVPAHGREFIAYHDEWVYLADFLGIKIEKFLEPKPGVPPSPQHILEIKEYITTHKVPAIIQASFYPTDAADSLNRDTGVKMLPLCQNVGERPECATTMSMLSYNIEAIAAVLN